LVPDAVRLERLSYREIVEMAHLGAKVVHPRAVEIAMEGRVPLRIRPTVGDGPGTLVCDGFGESLSQGADRIVTGIAHVPGRVQFRLSNGGSPDGDQIARDVFTGLGRSGV